MGIIHESTGDAAEAEILFRTGKELSHQQSLPTFGIAFSSLLGKFSKCVFLPFSHLVNFAFLFVLYVLALN